MLADVLAVVDIETMCVEQSSNEGKTSEDDGSSKRGRAAFLKFLTEVEVSFHKSMKFSQIHGLIFC